MAADMNFSSRALQRITLALALPILAAPLSASGATTPKAKPRAAAAAKPAAATKPVAANNSIIDLPLEPIVPAAQRLCASRTPSGLGYTVLRAGSGAKPSADATVLVNYIGYLASTGAVFDQGMRSPLPVGEVIQGFAQGLQMIPKTGIVRICIPAALGYGAQASGPIPANSDLVFQIEVLDFRSAAEIAEMRKAQAAAGEAATPKDPTPQQ
jgi:FKBP-type peptidyl-prolyl cis-trans isomerase FkpA